MIRLKTPLDKQKIRKLKVGTKVLLTGMIYTARDQAHRRLIQGIKKIPFDLKGQIIYYCGPSQRPKGKIIGSCGPTTSARMDKFTRRLLEKGLVAMIGKGRRCSEIAKAIKKHNAVYFVTYAGCGALLSKYIKGSRLIAYKDLGPEAIYELKVEDFPLIVAVDPGGNELYGQR